MFGATRFPGQDARAALAAFHATRTNLSPTCRESASAVQASLAVAMRWLCYTCAHVSVALNALRRMHVSHNATPAARFLVRDLNARRILVKARRPDDPANVEMQL